MLDRTTAPHSHHSVTFSQFIAVALPIILFAAVLLFAILVSLRYAQGWVNVAAEGAAAPVPMASDALAAAVATLATAVGVVWLYVKQLAR
jgi:hypothetical protein